MRIWHFFRPAANQAVLRDRSQQEECVRATRMRTFIRSPNVFLMSLVNRQFYRTRLKVSSLGKNRGNYRPAEDNRIKINALGAAESSPGT
jgi:hypothetical protein